MSPLSVRVSNTNQNFILHMNRKGMSKTDLVNLALDLLRKAKLQKELTAMASENAEEDLELANLGMEEYLSLLKNEDAAI